jgi:hypothetical protein
MKTASQNARAAAIKAAAGLKCDTRVCRFVASILIAGTLILFAVPKIALGNLFVLDTLPGNGTIAEYTNSGAPVNVSLLTGLGFVDQDGFGFGSLPSVATADGFLYVTNPIAGTIGKYTTSGATINAALISGLKDPQDIEIPGGELYVAERGNNRVGKYTTSGATVNASLITGIAGSNALAISATELFVGHGGTVGSYTISGATINASLATGFEDIHDVEVSGSSLFVSSQFDDGGIVAKYNVDGTLINFLLISTDSARSFAISGTDLFLVQGDRVTEYTTSGMFIPPDPFISGPFFSPTGIAVEGPASVPETLSTLWFGLTMAGLFAFAQRARVYDKSSPQPSQPGRFLK